MTSRPLRRQVLVSRDRAAAHRLFMHETASWWPLESFSRFGAGSSVVLEDDRWVETSPDGETSSWGTVVSQDPPADISFTWHPGAEPVEATQVRVTFVPAGSGAATLVTLEHAGWEARDDGESARASYVDGWRTVLGRFVAAGGTDDGTDPYWLVLQHTAGPATPPEGVFSSPLCAEHVRFLSRLRAERVLIAGGPLPDDPGRGMTVVRAAGLGKAREVLAAAQDDDGAVTGGLLEVRARPWQVAMSGIGAESRQ